MFDRERAFLVAHPRLAVVFLLLLGVFVGSVGYSTTHHTGYTVSATPVETDVQGGERLQLINRSQLSASVAPAISDAIAGKQVHLSKQTYHQSTLSFDATVLIEHKGTLYELQQSRAYTGSDTLGAFTHLLERVSGGLLFVALVLFYFSLVFWDP